MARYNPDETEVLTPSVRQATTLATAGTSITRSFSSTPLTGSLLVFTLFARDTTTFTPPAGFTAIGLQSATLMTFEAFYKFRAGGEPNSYQFLSSTNTGLTLIGLEILNADSSSPIAALGLNSQQSPTVTSITAPQGYTTVQANILAIAAGALNNFKTDWAFSNSFANQIPAAGSSTRSCLAYREYTWLQYEQLCAMSWSGAQRALSKLILIRGTRAVFTATIAGSEGGATFQKSGKVFSIRSRKVPIDKKSPGQSRSKNRFESVQGNWRLLDGTEQTSFENNTANFLRTDSLGNTYELTGQQLQSSANNNADANNIPRISTMTSPVVYPAFTLDTIALDVSLFAMDIVTNPVPVPAGFALRLFVTRPLSPGNQAQTNDYFLIGTVQAGIDTDSINWYSNYVALFGLPDSLVGSNIHVRATYISTDNNQPGTTVSDSGQVEA